MGRDLESCFVADRKQRRELKYEQKETLVVDKLLLWGEKFAKLRHLRILDNK